MEGIPRDRSGDPGTGRPTRRSGGRAGGSSSSLPNRPSGQGGRAGPDRCGESQGPALPRVGDLGPAKDRPPGYGQGSVELMDSCGAVTFLSSPPATPQATRNGGSNRM